MEEYRNIIIVNSLGSLEEIEATIQEEMSKREYAEEDIYELIIAFHEICLNSFIHGNKSDLSKKITIVIKITPERSILEISDEGEGFDTSLIDRHISEINKFNNNGKTSGRGILIAHELTDYMSYSNNGRAVILMKCKDVFDLLKAHPNRRRLETIRDEDNKPILYRASAFYEELKEEIICRGIELGLKLFGLGKRVYNNALNLTVTNTELKFANLPKEFNNFKILHLSDLHIDSDPKLPEILLEKVKDLDYDILVMSGDYRFKIKGALDSVHLYLDDIIDHAKTKSEIYCTLGNHDDFITALYLHQKGCHILNNDYRIIEKDGARLYLAGSDADVFYNASDISYATRDAKDDDFIVLATHSPSLYKKAVRNNVDLYLCGHTHGGQLCLPGGIPVITHTKAPRYMISGLWNYKNMLGYTNNGIGVSGIIARLNTLPEAAIITLTTT